jgi:hypothetical protein
MPEDDDIHALVASSNRGRYALDESGGSDLTAGDTIAIYLGGQWIEGHIEHAGHLYAREYRDQPERGYYFCATDGSCCGLCTGMRVRRL